MNPILIPAPRSIQQTSGTFISRTASRIRIDAADPSKLFFSAENLQRAIGDLTDHSWPITASPAASKEHSITLRLNSNAPHPEGYRLNITPESIEIEAPDAPGIFYGTQTLIQLFRQFPDALPCLVIEDHPDFAHRGVMLDISRDKVPTMQTLFALVDELAALKVNQFQLYMEHTFAYAAHPQVWAQASPMTPQEILDLDRYCRDRFIELVPNQQSFGHLERWLTVPKYLPLAEAPNGSDFPWGRREGPFSIAPTDPRSIELIASMYDELLEHFTSRQFNVGCDETFDLGQGRSKEECEKRGKERVYLEFLLKVYELVKKHGRTMQFWGDIILNRPQLISELPRDVIALEWGYEANHPFEKDGAHFREAGIPYYVCPGTSSWLSFTGRIDNAIANLKSAAENGLKHGAIGYLNTDWGDWGHLQYLPVSFPGFAAGAAYSWCYEANRDLPLAEALDLHIFRDSARVMGQFMQDFGTIYHHTKPIHNSTLPFWALLGTPHPQRQKDLAEVTREQFEAVERAAESAVDRLDSARMSRPDSGLIINELRNAGAMLTHACRRGKWKLDQSPDDRADLAADLSRIIGEHRRLWLARNRIGGLADSVRRLEKPLEDYR